MARVLWSQRQDEGPSARMGHAMAFDAARQRVVLFGGEVLESAFLADTWEWDGEFWTQVADTGPSPRGGHRLAFDSQASAVVLFGGSSGPEVLHGDTWQWNGEAWTQVADTGPGARAGHGTAYDNTRSRLVLFGGEAAESALQRDTWEWDGEAWAQIQDVGPAPRRYHMMAFDSARSRTMLFGGDIGAGSSAETWEWDGTSWVQVADTGPAACAAAAAAFDGSAVLLFGGVASLSPSALAPALSALTWEWDGEHWTLRQDMGPPARFGHELAFDTNRGRVVLFGGLPVAPSTTAAPSDLLADTWEAAAPAGAAAVELASFRLEPDAISGGGWSIEAVVDLTHPAPPEGVAVAISWPGSAAPVATILLAAGTTAGRTSFSMPGGAAPGTYELEARVGANARTATLQVLAISTALVSLRVTPETLISSLGGLLELDVVLDQPAPADLVVELFAAGGAAGTIPVAAGSTSGHAGMNIGAGVPVGPFPIEARLAGSVVTVTLFVGP